MYFSIFFSIFWLLYWTCIWFGLFFVFLACYYGCIYTPYVYVLLHNYFLCCRRCCHHHISFIAYSFIHSDSVLFTWMYCDMVNLRINHSHAIAATTLCVCVYRMTELYSSLAVKHTSMFEFIYFTFHKINDKKNIVKCTWPMRVFEIWKDI